VVLGYLNPEYFAGGAFHLDAASAFKAVQQIADPLGMSETQAAWAIHSIVNAKMADAIHLWTVGRGFDARGFNLVLLGGAGPVNGAMVAKSLSISELLVPITPGVLSAFGLLVANIEADNSTPFQKPAERVSMDALASAYQILDQKGLETMKQEQVPLGEVKVIRFADMRYIGQSYELVITIAGELEPKSVTRAVRDFHEKHQQVYDQSSTENPVEFVNLRTVHTYPLSKPRLPIFSGGKDWASARKGFRRAYFFPEFPDGVEVSVYDRANLPVNIKQKGPLIVEQADTTTVVYPGQHCRVDTAGNIILTNPVKDR
jgi:N-methylhydantoinase A